MLPALGYISDERPHPIHMVTFSLEKREGPESPAFRGPRERGPPPVQSGPEGKEPADQWVCGSAWEAPASAGGG